MDESGRKLLFYIKTQKEKLKILIFIHKNQQHVYLKSC